MAQLQDIRLAEACVASAVPREVVDQALASVNAGSAASLAEALTELGVPEAKLLRAQRECARGARGQLGRYRVMDTLGAGGMGQVLAVADDQLGRTLAAKVLHGAADDEQRARFELEARVTGQLEHPGIVPVHELALDAEGQPFFTMKRVAGRDLSAVVRELRQGNDLPLPELLRMFLKLCDALRYAHARGVIHRDLKPANVMLGEFGEVQVMDWGLAKIIDRERFGASAPEPRDEGAAPPAPESPDLPARHPPTWRDGSRRAPTATHDGQVMGTPGYMAPEQADGRVDELDERTDVYALGALLYELLTLQQPYEGDSPWSVLSAVLERDPAPPRQRAPERQIPWELEAIVLRAMARRADARYPSVAALQADIEAFSAGALLEAARYTLSQRIAKWLHRHRALVRGVYAVVAACVLLLALLGWRARRARLDAVGRHIAKARTLIGEAPALEVVARQARARRQTDGSERPESPTERDAREACLGAYLDAITSLETARRLDPTDSRAFELRRAAGLRLSRLAAIGGDWTLARQALRDLGRHGSGDEEIGRWLGELRERRQRSARLRRRLLERILVDVDAIADQPDRPLDLPTLEDHVFTAVGLREEPTVALLADALDRLTAKATEAGDRPAGWTGRERLRAELICRVLGRIELDSAIAPLGRFLDQLRDQQMARFAGDALGATRSRAAHPYLRRALGRFDPRSTTHKRLEDMLARAPTATPTDNDGADAVLRRAQALVAQGRAEEALSTLAALLARSPRNAAALREHAWALIVLQRDEAALTLVDRALRLPNLPPSRRHDLLTLRGISLSRLDRHDEALRAFDEVLAEVPEDSAARVNRGLALRRVGRLDEARVEFDLALRADPDQGPAWYNRARLRRDRGDVEGAVSDMGELLRRQPDHTDALFDRARLLVQLSRAREALQDAQTLRRLQPSSPRTHALLGRVLMQLGRVPEALAELDQAIAREPDAPHPYTLRGLARLRLRDLAGAREDLDRALALDRSNAEATLWRAILLLEEGQLDEALRYADKAVEAQPGRSKPWTTRAVIHAGRGDIDRAHADFARAARVDPRDAEIYVLRGDMYAEQGDLGAARRDYARATQLAPDNADYLAQRGYLRLRAGDRDGALRDLNEALSRAPKQVRALIYRGILHGQAGRADDALRDLNAAKALAPLRSDVWLNLGNVMRMKGELEPALAHYVKACELEPKVAENWLNRGLLLLKLRRSDEARPFLERARDRMRGQRRAELDALIRKVYRGR